MVGPNKLIVVVVIKNKNRSNHITYPTVVESDIIYIYIYIYIYT
jgi:hypothetical protein